VEGWLSKARPEDLLNVDIFFDMAPAAGDGSLAWDLQKEAIEAASGSPPFLALLAQSVQGVAPRVGFFGGLPSEEGRVDLKREGLLPLVSLARTLALRAGAASRATPERLRDAAAYGNLPKGDAEALIELHEELLTLVLRQQLADLQEGVRPSGRVALKELERHEQRRLTSGLKRLETVVGEIRSAISR
jgi:DNA polymerase-3 subunit epsilon/CBS domain-containing protein